MVLKGVLLGVALLFILEGLIVFIFPEWTKMITTKLVKKKNALRILGMVEFFLGLVLLLLSLGY